jgi:hypothetical protein
LIGFAVLVLLFSIFVARGISVSPPKVAITIALGIGVCILTFLKPEMGLYVLVFSMLLSPEFNVAQIPRRAVAVRIEDVLLIIIFFTWLVKLAANKELGVLRTTPLNRLVLIYVVMTILFTARGIIAGEVTPIKSFFFLLKYIEYFFLYFMVSNMVRDRGQAKGLIIAMFITCAIVCATTYPQIFHGERTTTPFEGEPGEPATLGGYLLLMMPVILSFFLYSSSFKNSFWLAVLFLFSVPPFLFSLSRASYAGFVPMFLTLAFLTKRKKGFLAGILILLVILYFAGVMPQSVKERIGATFTGKEYSVGPMKMELESSAGARIESWQNVLKNLVKEPLWGFGVTGIGFLDSQYFLVLGETGIIGIIVFLLLVFKIYTNTLKLFRSSQSEFTQSLSLGFLAGFAGLLTHALTSNTFIIVRIMEPFWFLTAILMILPRLDQAAEKSVAGVQK